MKKATAAVPKVAAAAPKSAKTAAKAVPKAVPKTAPTTGEATATTSSARESSKSKKTPTESEKKRATNRNVYESVDKEGGGANASGRASVAVNRNIYEAVGPTGEDGAQSTKPGAGGDYVMVGPDGEGKGAATEKAADGEMEEGSRKSYKERHRLRRQKRLEEERMLMGQKRVVIVGCIVLIGLILFLAALVAGAFLISDHDAPSKPRQKKVPAPAGNVTNATYGNSICKNHYQPLGLDMFGDPETHSDNIKMCVSVMGPAPKPDLTCKEIECFQNWVDAFASDQLLSFETGAPIKHRWSPRDITKTSLKQVNDTVFCRDYHHRGPMVCLKGSCDYRYVGKGSPYELNTVKGEWVDNCDEPMPCWTDYGLVLDHIRDGDTYKRDSCKNADKARCQPGMAAVVYLQQMACKMNPDYAGDFCDFKMPTPGDEDGMLRLFKCEDCVDDQWKYDDSNDDVHTFHTKLCKHKNANLQAHVHSQTNPCVIECEGGGQNVSYVLPDGAECSYKFGEGHDGYCVAGYCFWWSHNNARETIDYNMTECWKKKKEREEMKPAFGE